MDTWALAGAIKYGPQNAAITENSKVILKDLWADIAAHYNPYLSIMAGPVGLSRIAQITAHFLTKLFK